MGFDKALLSIAEGLSPNGFVATVMFKEDPIFSWLSPDYR